MCVCVCVLTDGDDRLWGDGYQLNRELAFCSVKSVCHLHASTKLYPQ